MTATLTAGGNAPLPAAREMKVTLRAAQGHADLIALLLDAADRADGDEGVVLFSHPVSAGGAVRLDQATDTITVDVGALPAAVERVLVVAQADGAPDVTGCGTLTAEVSADGSVAASASFSPLPAVATLRMVELYRRQGAWKVRALGDGYAEGLAKLLTVHGVEVTDDPAPQAVAPAPPAADPISLEKQRRVELVKKIEASGSVDLVKRFETAAVSLDKAGLTGQRAEVLLVLDVSGSSRGLFRRGTYQQLAERAMAAGLLFDDNGTIDTWLFDSRLREGQPVQLETVAGWADRAAKTPGIWGMTSYAPPIEAISETVQRGQSMPVFVFFVTDGGNQDRPETERAIKAAAGKPVFWKFMAIGHEDDFPFLQQLDDLTGREVDNADFFAVVDPLSLSDDEFYALVVQEFHGWLAAVRQAGILGS